MISASSTATMPAFPVEGSVKLEKFVVFKYGADCVFLLSGNFGAPNNQSCPQVLDVFVNYSKNKIRRY